jgi:hypothetical protein
VLSTVDHDQIGAPEHLRWHRPGWGRIEHEKSGGVSGGGGDGVLGDLQHGEHRVGADHVLLFHMQFRVRARYHDDGGLTRGVDGDQRQSGRHRDPLQPVQLDSLLAQHVQSGVGLRVGTHRRDQPDG